MFEPRVAIASLSGESNAEWATAASEFVGAAFLGGIALDGPTREAARQMTDREREEFLPGDPVAFVDDELAALDGSKSDDDTDPPLRAGFNVRSSSPEPIREVASVCADYDAILELNAHCRQDEMCAAGAGESLLRDTDRLCEQVEVAADECPDVSVKVRAELPGVDLPEVARRIADAGASAIHVDAMDSEPVIAEVADAANLFVIANNGVRDEATAREYLSYGADAVSVGRPSDDPVILARVREATEAWFSGEHSEEPNGEEVSL
ncbi:tRNA-dihydrouridine synthase [Halorussus halophilus]|uniref:tRNA-dihydrouridine synthase n=1 Tax=Halorussus halophilus TaxID=2650975 RepID=UPI00130124F6|nr:tRNA-dihydrouridine synthase [Halorussus halophilus]